MNLYQFDWSHEVVLLSGVTVIVKVAHVWLCHSRVLFVRAYQASSALILAAMIRFDRFQLVDVGGYAVAEVERED